mmetsp:Transcript_11036/g.17930  ORF Transcript_11036/g.17930 Transcript_11036/m.17930 type:complete len:981 (+) Transcript_11036:107-3049(+)
MTDSTCNEGGDLKSGVADNCLKKVGSDNEGEELKAGQEVVQVADVSLSRGQSTREFTTIKKGYTCVKWYYRPEPYWKYVKRHVVYVRQGDSEHSSKSRKKSDFSFSSGVDSKVGYMDANGKLVCDFNRLKEKSRSTKDSHCSVNFEIHMKGMTFAFKSFKAKIFCVIEPLNTDSNSPHIASQIRKLPEDVVQPPGTRSSRDTGSDQQPSAESKDNTASTNTKPVEPAVLGGEVDLKSIKKKCPTLDKVLKNPESHMEPRESIRLIHLCIEYGRKRSDNMTRSMTERKCVVIVGDTGVGKSTYTNYAFGKPIVKVRKQGKEFDSFEVREGTETLTEIGSGVASKTFMPIVITDYPFKEDKYQTLFCDPAGLLDNRCKALRIINAINLKSVIESSSSVVVVLMVNYYDVWLKRGLALRRCVESCYPILGSSLDPDKFKEKIKHFKIAINMVPTDEAFDNTTKHIHGFGGIYENLSKRCFRVKIRERDAQHDYKEISDLLENTTFAKVISKSSIRYGRDSKHSGSYLKSDAPFNGGDHLYLNGLMKEIGKSICLNLSRENFTEVKSDMKYVEMIESFGVGSALRFSSDCLVTINHYCLLQRMKHSAALLEELEYDKKLPNIIKNLDAIDMTIERTTQNRNEHREDEISDDESITDHKSASIEEGPFDPTRELVDTFRNINSQISSNSDDEMKMAYHSSRHELATKIRVLAKEWAYNLATKLHIKALPKSFRDEKDAMEVKDAIRSLRLKIDSTCPSIDFYNLDLELIEEFTKFSSRLIKIAEYHSFLQKEREKRSSSVYDHVSWYSVFSPHQELVFEKSYLTTDLVAKSHYYCVLMPSRGRDGEGLIIKDLIKEVKNSDGKTVKMMGDYEVTVKNGAHRIFYSLRNMKPRWIIIDKPKARCRASERSSAVIILLALVLGMFKGKSVKLKSSDGLAIETKTTQLLMLFGDHKHHVVISPLQDSQQTEYKWLAHSENLYVMVERL